VVADAIKIVSLPANIQYYVAVGDSITWGYGDDIGSDNVSADGRNSGPAPDVGGYEPILNNLLTNFTGMPHTIKNEGNPGETSAGGLARIFPPVDILDRYAAAKRYLVLYGMNDARPWLPVPSGEGLSEEDPGYAGSFKDNMQQILNAINSKGHEAILSKINIALGDSTNTTPYPDPDNGARSLLIQEYNVVIDELRAIPGNNISITPPDLYNYFKASYPTEYYDNIHPNGLGYQGLANQWFNALTQ
jgi:lysophospholipase L1-like esterase